MHPVQILNAFEPLLTINGGIKSTIDQSQITNILKVMQEHNTKLISKCVFCHVLTESCSDILERFLKIGGWDLICLWVKSSRDVGNITFLVRLLHLLFLLPMNIDRLRENECPKIVKKLCKHENQEVAQKASQIIKKWTKIIQTMSEKDSSQDGAASSKEKKRKSSDGSESSSKKAKSSGKSGKSDGHNSQELVGNKAGRAASAELSKTESCESKDMAGDEVGKTSDGIGKSLMPKRPITAKVKQGKFRLDLSAPSHKSNESKAKKKDGDTKKQVPSIKLVDIPKKPPVSSPYILKDSISFMDAITVVPVVSKKRRKIIKEPEPKGTSTNQTAKIDPVVNVAEITPSPIVGVPPLMGDNLNNNNSHNNTLTHDTSVAKSDNNESDRPRDISVSSESQKSPPKFSFYKDILDEKCNDSESTTATTTTNSNNTTSNINSQVSKETVDGGSCDNTPQVDISDDKVDSNDSDKTETDEVAVEELKPISLTETRDATFKLKSILCYVKKDSSGGGKKKSVRWPEDSNLEKVKYFEMDETERINVNRPSSDMKRFDMKHEGQMMMEAKKTRCFTYGPWKLVTIDTPPDTVVYGCNSKEREVQTERMKTTLECIYIQDHLPDTPLEPDPEFHLAISLDQIPIIPVNDQNSGEQNIVQNSTEINNQVTPTEPSFSGGGYANQSGDFTSYTGAPSNGFPPVSGQAFTSNSGSFVSSTSTPPNNFEGAHGGSNCGNSGFNSFNNYIGPNIPPSSNSTAPSAYPTVPNNSNLYPNYSTSGPPRNSPPSMYSQCSPNHNYYPNNHGPPQPNVNEPSFNSTYWPEANNRPPGPMPDYHPRPPFGGRGGPRFRGARGGRGGRFPRSNEMCRFYFKTGKCKFENRCNFSHSVDTHKPPVRF